MANKETDSFISTDAKVLIKNWQVLCNLIETHTQTTEQISKTDAEAVPMLLSQHQLSNALSGPYQRFFKQKLTAYATVGKLLLEINTQQDEYLNATDSIKEAHPKLKKLLEKYTMGDVNSVRCDLDKLLGEHNEQWSTLLEQWNQQLLQHLNDSQIPLSDIEIQAFKEKEPLSELIRRYSDLNIELPELDYSNLGFEQFLRLKLELAIRSSLNRRHEAHANTDVGRKIKKFKSKFAKIKQQEHELLKTQKLETQKIVKPILF